MRLLHTKDLELIEFVSHNRPQYAILSHTWGEGEVLFNDAHRGQAHLLRCGKLGLAKVLKAAEVAKDNGYDYIWIDTCCIDKSSSAELSEAINSMFAWYAESAVCYAYISDFPAENPEQLSLKNRWFTRGWTLQELIAPPTVEFYNQQWVKFGSRDSLWSLLSSLTGIDELVFRWHPYSHCPVPATEQQDRSAWPRCRFCRTGLADVLGGFSIATRMSWAANRSTMREEDIAYSLLGLFGVNLPLLYGERHAAFQRLQHEIVRNSTDQSIFTFSAPRAHLDLPNLPNSYLGLSLDFLFAASPAWFAQPSREWTNRHFNLETPMVLLSRVGIQLDVYMAPALGFGDFFVAVLICSCVEDALCSPALIVEQRPGLSTLRRFQRVWMSTRPEDHDELLFSVAAGSGMAVGKNSSGQLRIKFDPANLKRETILLQAARQIFNGRFSPPPSGVEVVRPSYPADLNVVKHHVPLRFSVQTRGIDFLETRSRLADTGRPLVIECDDPRPLSRANNAVVCGVVGIQAPGRTLTGKGLLLVWGKRNITNDFLLSQINGYGAPLDPAWYLEDPSGRDWYTAVYPWTPAGITMDAELSSFDSVQKALIRCCEETVPLTDATELTSHLDGSCERTWLVKSQGETTRVWVKATITPVEHLSRKMVKIAVTVVPTDQMQRVDKLSEVR